MVTFLKFDRIIVLDSLYFFDDTFLQVELTLFLQRFHVLYMLVQLYI